MPFKVNKTDEQWKAQLSPEQYRVCREKGTEPAFSGELTNCKAGGDYLCAGCNAKLFDSSGKYESGCGWPSFTAPSDQSAIGAESDTSFGMRRTEVHCAECGSHLGHVFDDGPQPAGLRYCINSASLQFVES